MLDFSGIEQVILLTVTTLVLIAEAGNTAVEAVVDRVSLEWHDLSKKAKDVGSFMVFLAMINWLLAWGILLSDKL